MENTRRDLNQMLARMENFKSDIRKAA